MNLGDPVGNVELALFHARCLMQLRSLNPQANIDAILKTELTNGFQSTYYPPTVNTVGMYFGGDNGRKICYLDGVVSIAQANNLMGGYLPLGGLQINPNDNLWIQANILTYKQQMAAGHLGLTEYVDYVGYSAGGAVATALMFEESLNQSIVKRKLFTFGAPRAGGSAVRDALATAPIRRYMNDDDPIPLIPPRIQDAPLIAALISPLIWNAYSNTVHTQGGVEITSTPSLSPKDLPSKASVDAIGSLANWFFSEENDPANPHAMATYVDRLQRFLAPLPPGPAPVAPEAPAEKPQTVKRKEVARAQDRVVTAIANQQHAQFNVNEVIPDAVLFLPVRQGRVWAVQFGEKFVAQGVNEKTCRHLCRAGNDFFRSLPKQGIVDITSILEQVEKYFAFATDPSTGFAPQIQTTLPLNQ